MMRVLPLKGAFMWYNTYFEKKKGLQFMSLYTTLLMDYNTHVRQKSSALMKKARKTLYMTGIKERRKE